MCYTDGWGKCINYYGKNITILDNAEARMVPIQYTVVEIKTKVRNVHILLYIYC